jgi:hypothetical protein
MVAGGKGRARALRGRVMRRDRLPLASLSNEGAMKIIEARVTSIKTNWCEPKTKSNGLADIENVFLTHAVHAES